MGLLANLKLRKKLLIALAPLALMMVFAGLYGSYESKRIDSLYSRLIDGEIRAVHDTDVARALNTRYGFYLFRLISEPSPDRARIVDAELESCYAEYKARLEEASHLYPAYEKQISDAIALFDKGVLDSRPVRSAALANEQEKATRLMRSDLVNELERSRDRAIEVSNEMQKAVLQRSDDLTAKTHRTILITCLVIAFGILT